MEWDLLADLTIAANESDRTPECDSLIFAIKCSTNTSKWDFAGSLIPVVPTPFGLAEARGLSIRAERLEIISFPHPMPAPFYLEFRASMFSRVEIWKPKLSISGVNMFVYNPFPTISLEQPNTSASSAVNSTVQPSLVSVEVLASNSARKHVSISNNSGGRVVINAGASASYPNEMVGQVLEPNGLLHLEKYTGVVSAVWLEIGTGVLTVTEFV